MDCMTPEENKVLSSGVGRATYCTLSPHEWTWTDEQALEMARALMLLGRKAGQLEGMNKKLKEKNDSLSKRFSSSIVCLCGSTRFMEEFFDVGWQLTLGGDIVLSVGVCKHADDHGGEALGQDVVERLDELHKRKIDLCDWVMVLNVDGYIGESTSSEIEYARKHGKPIKYLCPEFVK